MNFAIGSKNAPRARVDELLLGDLADEMATLGWSTFGVFAFSSSLFRRRWFLAQMSKGLCLVC